MTIFVKCAIIAVQYLGGATSPFAPAPMYALRIFCVGDSNSCARKCTQIKANNARDRAKTGSLEEKTDEGNKEIFEYAPIPNNPKHILTLILDDRSRSFVQEFRLFKMQKELGDNRRQEHSTRACFMCQQLRCRRNFVSPKANDTESLPVDLKLNVNERRSKLLWKTKEI